MLKLVKYLNFLVCCFTEEPLYLVWKYRCIVLQLKRILLNGGAKKEFYLSSLVQYVICDDEDTAKRIEEDVKEANPEAVIVKVSMQLYLHFIQVLELCL